MTLGEIIKKYRDEHEMSMYEFSKKSGISKAYISLLEKNKHPKTGKPIAPSLQIVKQAAAGMGMDFDDLFSKLDGEINLKSSRNQPRRNDRPENSIPISDFHKIPLYSEIAGGKPIEMNNTVIDRIPVYGIPDNGEYFALKIKGRSMEPKILDGDIVVVHKQEDAENGETVAISVDGENATCKRLYKYADHIALLSYNSDYAPMEFTDRDIKEKPVRIYGKVVKLMRDM